MCDKFYLGVIAADGAIVAGDEQQVVFDFNTVDDCAKPQCLQQLRRLQPVTET